MSERNREEEFSDSGLTVEINNDLFRCGPADNSRAQEDPDDVIMGEDEEEDLGLEIEVPNDLYGKAKEPQDEHKEDGEISGDDDDDDEPIPRDKSTFQNTLCYCILKEITSHSCVHSQVGWGCEAKTLPKSLFN